MKSSDVIKLQVNETSHNYAKIYATMLTNEFRRKRAYASIVALNALALYMETTSYTVQKSMTLYRNPMLNEQYEINDVYINNYHIDVRVFINGENVLLPKIHFDKELQPDFYAIVKIDKSLRNADLVGFVDVNNVNVKILNDKYCYVNLNTLISTEDFLTKTQNPKNQEFSDEEHEFFLDNLIALIDNETDENTKIKLIKHAFNCRECRTEFCCFTGFELVSNKAVNYPDLFSDFTLDIVGANSVDNEKYKGREEVVYIGDDEKEAELFNKKKNEEKILKENFYSEEDILFEENEENNQDEQNETNKQDEQFEESEENIEADVTEIFDETTEEIKNTDDEKAENNIDEELKDTEDTENTESFDLTSDKIADDSEKEIIADEQIKNETEEAEKIQEIEVAAEEAATEEKVVTEEVAKAEEAETLNDIETIDEIEDDDSLKENLIVNENSQEELVPDKSIDEELTEIQLSEDYEIENEFLLENKEINDVINVEDVDDVDNNTNFETEFISNEETSEKALENKEIEENKKTEEDVLQDESAISSEDKENEKIDELSDTELSIDDNDNLNLEQIDENILISDGTDIEELEENDNLNLLNEEESNLNEEEQIQTDILQDEQYDIEVTETSDNIEKFEEIEEKIDIDENIQNAETTFEEDESNIEQTINDEVSFEEKSNEEENNDEVSTTEPTVSDILDELFDISETTLETEKEEKVLETSLPENIEQSNDDFDILNQNFETYSMNNYESEYDINNEAESLITHLEDNFDEETHIVTPIATEIEQSIENNENLSEEKLTISDNLQEETETYEATETEETEELNDNMEEDNEEMNIDNEIDSLDFENAENEYNEDEFEENENVVDEDAAEEYFNGTTVHKSATKKILILFLSILIFAGASFASWYFYKNGIKNDNNSNNLKNNKPKNTVETYENTDLFGVENSNNYEINQEGQTGEIIPSSNNESVNVPLPDAVNNAQSNTYTPQPITENDIIKENTDENNANITKSLANAFSGAKTAVALKDVSWLCSPKLFTDNTFKSFMHSLDSILKVNLKKNLLNASELPKENTVTVKMAINNFGNINKILISHSSGSDEIDKIVLQSINETFVGEKSPICNNEELKSDVYYLKLVIKL